MSIKFRDAEPSNASKAKIDKFAGDFAERIELRPAAPLEPVVSQLGGRITYQTFSELQDSAKASIKVYRQGEFEIFLADYTSVAQDRFSIAHEIGHYLLHFPLHPDHPMQAARYGSTRVEWEANWFAAGFLMPRKDFEPIFRQCGRDIVTIAARFGVSKAAAKIRIESLGLRA